MRHRTNKGSRQTEEQYVLDHLGTGAGRVMDLGCGRGKFCLALAKLGWEVDGVDPMIGEDRHPAPGNFMTPDSNRIRFIRANFVNDNSMFGYYDMIVSVSAIEHAGLAGRYNVEVADSDEDLRICQLARECLAPGGKFIITVPAGLDSVQGFLHRIYGKDRLPLLLQGWKIIHQSFMWNGDSKGTWSECSMEDACGEDGTENLWNLAMFTCEVENANT